MKGHRKCQKDPGDARNTGVTGAQMPQMLQNKGLYDHLCSARALLTADESQRAGWAKGQGRGLNAASEWSRAGKRRNGFISGED